MHLFDASIRAYTFDADYRRSPWAQSEPKLHRAGSAGNESSPRHPPASPELDRGEITSGKHPIETGSRNPEELACLLECDHPLLNQPLRSRTRHREVLEVGGLAHAESVVRPPTFSKVCSRFRKAAEVAEALRNRCTYWPSIARRSATGEPLGDRTSRPRKRFSPMRRSPWTPERQNERRPTSRLS